MATEWKKVKLGEICDYVTSGGTPLVSRNDYYNPPVIPWLKTKEVNYSRITKTENFISQKGLDNSSAKLIPENSVIIAMYGQGDTAGRVAINKIPLTTNQACCNFIIDKEKADYNFIYYQLCTLYDKMVSLKSGGAQPNLNAGKLKELEISLPPLETQQKIAGILSAYDDLIENNRKQIKLLEEAAQKLYKEWFVKLNFPGHENVKIVDGVPEGWKIITAEDLIGKLESGSRPKGGIDSTIKKGIASVGAENVIGLGQYNYSSEKFVNKEFYENAKRGKIEDKDILIYKDGAYIGRTSLFQDNFPHKEAMINEHVFLLHAREESNQYFIFFTLYQRTYFEKMQKLNKNAAQPGINQDAIKSLKFFMPAEQLIRVFDNFVTPIVKRIFVLAKQNSQLQSARDKLLPRLMNGEI